MVKTIIQIQVKVVPPPLSHLVFDNGGGVPLFGTEGVAREVASVDKSIDGLVASRELYGLSEEEIGIVES